MPVSDRQRALLEAIATRDQAEAALQSLIRLRDGASGPDEAKAVGTGRADLFREVTGASAIDNAIRDTRRMIETLNAALEQARRELAAEPALVFAAGA